VFIGPNITEGMIRFAFWFFSISILLLSIWAARHQRQWVNRLVWSLSIGSFIFSIRYWESYILDYGKPNYNIHVLFSPIGHVNFTGDVLIILLPMLLWVLATYNNAILRVLNLFSVTTIATILLVASSRGALGGLFIAFIITLLFLLKHHKHLLSHKSDYIVPSLLMASTLMASWFIYNALPYHYRDLARVSASAGQATTGQGKIILTPQALQPPLVNMWVKLSPLLGARTPIFAATTAMTLDAPILGQGTGNFAWVYPNYSNRYPDFRDPLSSARTFTTNPHNVALQIASQNGIPAMLIFMGLLLYLWLRLAKASWQQWNAHYITGLAAISAVLFDAMFNHVFFNPASMFVFSLLAGTWWGLLPAKSQGTLSIKPKLLSVYTMVIVVLLCIWPVRWLMSEWYVGQAMAHIQQPAQEINFYQKAYALDNENFRASFGMGQVAYKQKNYGLSAKYFEEFQTFYPYNPPALNMLGAAYMSTGQFKKAEAVFEQALKVYPGFTMVEQNLQRVKMILKQRKR
ncbi:MAG: O-antigen ligase family protein, partial [Ghiorsea sp.]|nr:O-antigen ligase family protein [Ghiorsea sp.]